MALLLKENTTIALEAIKSNKLRALITMLIIAIGIMALVGILSAIDAIKSSINSNFTEMGANTFTIRNKETTMRVGRHGKRPKAFKSITYKEAMRFKEEFDFPCVASVSTLASWNARLKFGSKKTNPNIQVFGTDENYLETSGYELLEGRNFTPPEILSGNNLVILGNDVAYSLFPKNAKAVDKIVSIGGTKYKVIGVLKTKGNSMGFGGDKICIIPMLNARQYFGKPDMSFTLNVISKFPWLMDIAVGEATGLFRKIRKINAKEDEDFDVVKSDSLATMLIGNLATVTLGATIIGIITLLGAAIGLMNIMLVSVTERTREIGIRKALGATQQAIKNQFLIESVVICVMGGLIGILLGIIIGNLIGMGLNTGFFVPWFWIFMGTLICIVVGLVSGFLPAKRASKLDPIESLRFE
ncbi:MAG TPA: ABC transporter permease [Bacteroidia bacterium]|jgi:putative ABC transport system permease protein|nr:ABC transporter permease [Bacteroidia bacterium]